MENETPWLPAIQTALQSVRDLYNSQQFDEITRIYAENIRLFPPNIPEQHGKAAVVDIFKEMFSLGGTRVEMASIEILKEDTDWAMAKQNFTLYSNQGYELFTAKMIHTWRRKDGGAEVTLAIWNFDSL
ncbi:uncharacterized protein LOC135464960 [Liolophura sinensis]|uniref:uncharacterized protein LOC135464960 n=1 Tax=Liolophura sinensis TaxID=3198878 RepID=UPI0031580824